MTQPVAFQVRAAVRRILAGHAATWLGPLSLGWALALPAAAAELPMPCVAGSCGSTVPGFVSQGSGTASTSGNTLTVTQTSDNATFNWQNFNISADGTVNFVQPGVSSVAMNRIFQNDPSRIFGSLNANGRVYLLNQNGILFGSGAKVNVGSMIASSLDFTPEALSNGILGAAAQGAATLSMQNGVAGAIDVEAGASLRAASGGQIFLFAPEVTNKGTITTPDGQTVLGAGGSVYLLASGDPSLRGVLVEVGAGGTAANLGDIVAARGNVTLVGLAVNQQGRINATTSVRANGSIRLLARDGGRAVNPPSGAILEASNGGVLTLGEDSRTEVTLDASDATEVDQSEQLASLVELDGHRVNILDNSLVGARGGKINITASAGKRIIADNPERFPETADDSRIYIAEGATIDVAGADAAAAMERNSLRVELRGSQVADSPEQRDGALRGKTVFVDVRDSGTREDGTTWQGTPLADVSGDIAGIRRDVRERSSLGGTITMASDGDVIVASGSKLDLSGGTLAYADGWVSRSQVLGADGKLYDIAAADPDREYIGIASNLTIQDTRWGTKATYSAGGDTADRRFESGYVEGKDAGALKIIAANAVLDGDLRADVTVGTNQRLPTTELAASQIFRNFNQVPDSAYLQIGYPPARGFSPPNYVVTDVVVQHGTSLPGIGSGDELPEGFGVRLPTQWIGEGRIGHLDIATNGTFLLPENVDIDLPAGGSLEVLGAHVRLLGDIDAPGGTLIARTGPTLSEQLQTTGSNFDIVVGAGAQLTFNGGWINDAPSLNPGGATAPLWINGGQIELSTSVGGLVLESGSLLDVSGGAYRATAGGIQAGEAGGIVLSASPPQAIDGAPDPVSFVLAGELRGQALHHGGSLSLRAPEVCISATLCNEETGTLWLRPEFFRSGFADYDIRANARGLTVAPGASIEPVQYNLVLGPGADLARTGTAMSSLTSLQLLPLLERAPANLSLGNSVSVGSSGYDESRYERPPILSIGAGSGIFADPLAHISLSSSTRMEIAGTLQASGGSIDLTLGNGLANTGYVANQGIWLSGNARLDVSGTALLQTDSAGLVHGNVLSGGDVTILAQRGFFAMGPDASIDVSGTAASIDLQTGPGRIGRQTVGSAGGSLDITVAEGALLGGKIEAGSGLASHYAGDFSLTVDAANRGDRLSSLYPFTTAAREVFLTDNVLALTVAPGTALPDAYIGRAIVTTQNVAEFDSVSLGARNLVRLVPSSSGDLLTLTEYGRVRLDGGLDFSTRARLLLDAPVISADGSARLSSAFLSLANSDVRDFGQNTTTVADAAGGTLKLQADVIDVLGNVAVTGVNELHLESASDISLRGIAVPASGARRYSGALTADDRIVLDAAQIFPTTLTDFTIAVADTAGGEIITRGGDSKAPEVLSAAGHITLLAPVVDHGGRIVAPFGEISMGTTEFPARQVTLRPGSLLSTTVDTTIPFGTTQGGFDWTTKADYTTVYGTDGEAVPEKRVSISADVVDFQGDARIDVSAGGELQAYEWVPGVGGSQDYLDATVNPGLFAILPRAALHQAPSDGGADYANAQLAVGDAVYLEGIKGLPAGEYVLLPARYALLPGAFLVSAAPDAGNMYAGEVRTALDGSAVVAGYRTIRGTSVRDSQITGFNVRSGAEAHDFAQYDISKASDFFAAQALAAGATAPRLAGDAGRVAFIAGSSLDLSGTVDAAAAKGGRGAAVDISSARVRVVDEPGRAVAGEVQLSAAQLSALGAESLLIGGRRESTATGTSLQVSASHVTVDEGIHLQAPELLLAATDTVRVEGGARLEASGAIAQAEEKLQLQGDSALLRVSRGSQVELQRDGATGTTGTLDISSTATLAAANGSLTYDASSDTLALGVLEAAGASLSLGASRISFGDAALDVDGLLLDGADLDALGLDQLVLNSRSSFDVHGETSLSVDELVLNGAGIAAAAADTDAHLHAGKIRLSNTNGATMVAPAGSGSLAISADEIELDAGRFGFAGFGTASLSAEEDMAAVGNGTLAADGELALSANRFTGSAGGDYQYIAQGALTLDTGTVHATADDAPLGTRLAFEGSSVTSHADIDAPAGIVEFHATGADGDVLLAGGHVDVAGRSRRFDTVRVDAGAGRVTLRSEQGDARIEEEATLHLGAAHGAKAGTLEMLAPRGTLALAGTVSAIADGGLARGGRFVADAASLGDFDALNASLSEAGFTAARNLRQRGAGNLTIGSEWKVAELDVTADQGSIRVTGNIDADGADDAHVTLAARDDIRIDGGIDLSSDAGEGGRVELLSREGGVQLTASSHIDVTGSMADGSGNGSVHLRFPRTAAGTMLDADAGNDRLDLAGTISGADSVTLEGYAAYGTTALNLNPVASNPLYTEADAFASSGAALLQALGRADDARYLVTPGIELDSTGTFTLASAWDLGAWRFGPDKTSSALAVPGVLTLRAGSDLLLNASLSDGFSGGASGMTLLPEGSRSWSYRLVSGADFSSANPLGVMRGATATGNITLRNGTAANKIAVRTGTGRMELAAAGDISLGGQFAVLYTAGTQGPGIPLTRTTNQGGFGAAGLPYPINGGDITLRAGRNVLGAATNQLVTAWQWRTGSQVGVPQSSATAWTISFASFEENIGALAGGDVDISAGGDIRDLHVSIPTIGRQVGGTTPELSQVEVIGGGDLDLRAGGSILGGSIYVGRGHASLNAERSIGNSTTGARLAPILALGDAAASLAARSALAIETVLNPTLLPQGSRSAAPTLQNVGGQFQSFFSTYTPDAAVDLTSVAGSVRIGTVAASSLQTTFSSIQFTDRAQGLYVYAPTLRVAALSGDIDVGAPIYLYPAARGNLQLLAERDLRFSPIGTSANLVLSDVDPASLPTAASPDRNLSALVAVASPRAHGNEPVHQDDEELVTLVARTGDILVSGTRGVSIGLAKPARIVAGRDLLDLPTLDLQNLDAADVTSLIAGRDLRYSLVREEDGRIRSSTRNIALDGPGLLDIEVGRNLDLQTSGGISTMGATRNGALPETGASISVIAGISGVQPDIASFIEQYLEEGTGYDTALTAYMAARAGAAAGSKEARLEWFRALPASEQLPLVEQLFFAELRASGRYAAQSDPVANGDFTRGFEAIQTLLPGANPDVDADEQNAFKGDINLFFSQIYTLAGGDISLLAPGGEINVGLATPPVAFGIEKAPSQLGLVARRTGDINAFSYADLQVNESRAFAADGGDILIWSTRGDIDAGRGAKTALSVPPPTITAEPSGRINVVFSPPLQGSGIQTLATSDGVKAGDVDLFAPRGVVNAGDAGIVAGNLTIAATAVLGADNIQVSGIAVGVPVDTGGLGASLSSVSNAASSAASAAATAVETDRTQEEPAQLADSALTWLDVFVTGFGEEQCAATDAPCLERQRNKQ